ncbi:uncharacterized protein ACA1_060070 [Acanthamoeba castellanii str. Neff]|uniref:Uncharacterized protein n=1 Tax=Acanthamoeba castellanii (strain ATCC 30010 / Neff) TaxID=1257118 RepID=L8GWA1_ACACF|nr:uncharacterized protein ACA1_060070 [Acanthamoeba castellanii str. Neff]ELR17280.1 hypothetical protein ACA1_060070 [Acanthamoeba castellanii str. Neff]
MGVNSNELTTLGFIQLPISLGSMTQAVKFHIMPACPASVLLGTRALHNFSITIQFKRQELVLPGGKAVPFLVTAATAAQYRVFLSEELVAEGPTPWTNNSVNLLVEPTKWGSGLKTARVAQALADGWHNKEGKHWTMTNVANFSMRPIHLSASTPLAKAKWVEDNWVCSAVEPGAVEGPGTPFDGVAPGSKVKVETPVNSGMSEGMSKAPYHNTLSWEPMATATAVDINGMVSRADTGLSANGGGVSVNPAYTEL